MKKVVYNGPAAQVNLDVAAATGGSAELEPEREYELPADLADKLLASSAWWSAVKATSKPKAKED